MINPIADRNAPNSISLKKSPESILYRLQSNNTTEKQKSPMMLLMKTTILDTQDFQMVFRFNIRLTLIIIKEAIKAVTINPPPSPLL